MDLIEDLTQHDLISFIAAERICQRLTWAMVAWSATL